MQIYLHIAEVSVNAFLLLGLGGLFIAVVMAFPNGLAGIWAEQIAPRLARLTKSGAGVPIPAPGAKSPAE